MHFKPLKSVFSFVVCCVLFQAGFAQPALVEQVKKINATADAFAPFRFLAADELMGRNTTRPEIHVAARYIAEQFRSAGVKEANGAKNYFQHFTISTGKPANSGSFTLDSVTFNIGNNTYQLSGNNVLLEAPVVFVNFGTEADLEKTDVKGKIVVATMGQTEGGSVMDAFDFTETRQKMLQQKGAVALIELFRKEFGAWDRFKRFLMREKVLSGEPSLFPVLIVNDEQQRIAALANGQKTGRIATEGNVVSKIPARNVVGIVEGTDPRLKHQYIVLSAHYDHIGVSTQPKTEGGKTDSIYNGARDNAIGVTAIINAGKYFAKYRPKRSVLLVAFTAEEMGLVGSRHFVADPPVRLDQVVYNINIDNAGYNDTTIVSVVGLGRTSADNDIKRAAKAFGMQAHPDPAPEQDLFDRSDNVNFAIKGIPAPTFSLGMRSFDESVSKYYHQLSDEVESFDFNYGRKYMSAFILAAKYIADNPVTPTWIKGDKYEAAWKVLHKK